jgi:hypothetical protein
LSAQAVTAAPAGLVAIFSSAALASAATGGATALTVLKIMSMTKLKVGIASAVVAAAIAIPVIMHQGTQKELREKEAALKQQSEQAEQLAAENERLVKLAGQAADTPANVDEKQAREVIKLRGEVGRLRQENENIANAKPTGASALNELMNPEMKKLIRDQQKMGLDMIYKGFADKAKLPKEQSEKLTDALADNIMDNIDRITEVLRDGKSPAEMDLVFAEQEKALLEKVQSLLSAEEFAQYQDFTHNLASYLTAEQFKPMMTGDKAAKDEKAKQINQLMQEISRQALVDAGLSPDFQLAPTLNFRNFASEQVAEKNLKLLSDVYERLIARSDSFLSADELKKLREFQAKAINNNRMMLAMNRKMMAPAHR